MWSASKEIASGLCVAYLPWHTNQGTLVAISYLKKEGEREEGRRRSRTGRKLPSFAIKAIVEEKHASDGLTQLGYLLG